MAKPRVLVPNGIYHIGTRGSGRQRIVLDVEDFDLWVEQLELVASPHGWHVLAYTVIPNHFHLIVRDPKMTLSSGMRVLNGGFSRKTNARHGRDAHLFRNRFWSDLIETTESLKSRLRYVDRNAPEAKLCSTAADWFWSSHAAVLGLRPAPAWLAVDEVLRLFGNRREIATERYRAFVEGEEQPSHWSDQGDGSVMSL